MQIDIHTTPPQMPDYGNVRSIWRPVQATSRGYLEPGPLVAEYEDLVLGDSGLKVRAVLYEDCLYVGSSGDTPFQWWGFPREMKAHVGPPLFKAEILGPASTQVVTKRYTWFNESGDRNNLADVSQTDCYVKDKSPYEFNPEDPRRTPYIYLPLRLTFPNGEVREEEYRFCFPEKGIVRLQGDKIHVSLACLGLKHEFVETFEGVIKSKGQFSPYRGSPFGVLQRFLMGSFDIEGGPDALWALFLNKHYPKDEDTPLKGLLGIYKRKRIAANLARLKTEAPVDWHFFRWLHGTNTPRPGYANNKHLARMLTDIGSNYDQLLAKLRDARATPMLPYGWFMDGWVTNAICTGLSGMKLREV